jgi:hypothetical protein
VLEIRYNWTSWDSAHPNSGAKSIVFFDAAPRQPDGSKRITELVEAELIQWIVTQAKARVFNDLGLPESAFHRSAVVDPFYRPTEGDLDLVLWNSAKPQLAVAVECKRVKVTTLDGFYDKVNKLNDVAEGVRQANRLYKKFPFFQTYLMVMTALDASLQEEANLPCRGASARRSPDYGETRTLPRIIYFPEHDALDRNIGIIFVEFVQSSGVSFAECGSLGVYVHRAAQPREQLEDVTNRLLTLIQ